MELVIIGFVVGMSLAVALSLGDKGRLSAPWGGTAPLAGAAVVAVVAGAASRYGSTAGWSAMLVLGAVVCGWLLVQAVRTPTRSGGAYLAFSVGGSFNLVPMSINGAMPVSLPADHAVATGAEPRARHAVLTGSTEMSILGDVIPLGPAVISVGDVVLVVGMILLAWSVCHQTDAHSSPYDSTTLTPPDRS